MFIPYKVDVPMARWPIANWVLMAVIILTSIGLFGAVDQYSQEAGMTAFFDAPLPAAHGSLALFLLQPAHFHPFQLVGNLLTHAGWLHLLGNMLFLWVFGNAVNAKIGQWQYILFFFGIGIFEGLIWLIIGPNKPVLGASGAIMGVVGAFLLLYPLNNISCLFTLGLFFTRTVEFSSGWLIALYAIFDIYGAIFQRHEGVAYLAHVAGFGAGAGLIFLALKKQWLAPAHGERSLLQVLGWMPDNPEDFAPIPDTYLKPASKNRPAATPAQPPRRPPTKPRDDSPIPLD
jgi:membrane associated rhomboid family serine protease